VLAGLALGANRPVSLRRLVTMAWADAPPPFAIANLRSHVAALRQAVSDRIVAYTGAYLFRVGPDELDVTEFLRLAGVGRASAAAEDYHARSLRSPPHLRSAAVQPATACPEEPLWTVTG
jgi:DNA-binding SARP family transcriptional activator